MLPIRRRTWPIEITDPEAQMRSLLEEGVAILEVPARTRNALENAHIITIDQSVVALAPRRADVAAQYQRAGREAHFCGAGATWPDAKSDYSVADTQAREKSYPPSKRECLVCGRGWGEGGGFSGG